MVLTLYEAYGIYSLFHDSAATYQHHYSLIGFLNRYFVVPFYLLVYLLFCLEEYDTEYPLFTITDSESSFNLDEKNKWSDQTIAKADEKGRTSRLLYSCSLELLFFFFRCRYRSIDLLCVWMVARRCIPKIHAKHVILTFCLPFNTHSLYLVYSWEKDTLSGTHACTPVEVYNVFKRTPVIHIPSSV